MGCRKLQLQDYFQFIENDPIKYCSAIFIFEQYTYDPAGNILKKTVRADSISAPVTTTVEYDNANQLVRADSISAPVPTTVEYDNANQLVRADSISAPVTTTYEYDKANQLVRADSISAPGKAGRTEYTYDAAGRMVKEGNKIYQYGWLDKVMSITENGKVTANYDYHVSGQIATASVRADSISAPMVTSYEWDGLALIRKNSTNLTNEPAVTGGNAILADNKVLFNDMLGTTLGVVDSGKINSIKRDAFGQTFANAVDNKYNKIRGQSRQKC